MAAFVNRAAHEYRHIQDEAVKDELHVAGIPCLALPSYLNLEVKTSYIGILNGFVFTRAWRYWICNGYVSLDHAKEIYAQMGQYSVRAGGHASNPEPECIAKYVLRDQRVQLYAEELAARKHMDSLTALRIADMDIQPDPNDIPYVNGYHIDCEEGLKALADYIRAHNVHAVSFGEPTFTVEKSTNRAAKT